MSEHSPMPWKYLEQTGFVVDANGVYIAQTWNKNEENFPNAVANGNAIAQLTAENAKLRAELAEAVGLLYEAFHDGYQGCPMDGTEWLANAYKVLKANGNSGRALEWYERKPK